MSVIACARCCRCVDTDREETDPDCEYCIACASSCPECGVEIDPEEKHRECADCQAIARADHERDVAKDRRAEGRT